ncbi:hypothetical protein GOP47_0003480, partial [Adiantum capillus-veneris]
ESVGAWRSRQQKKKRKGNAKVTGKGGATGGRLKNTVSKCKGGGLMEKCYLHVGGRGEQWGSSKAKSTWRGAVSGNWGGGSIADEIGGDPCTEDAKKKRCRDWDCVDGKESATW